MNLEESSKEHNLLSLPRSCWRRVPRCGVYDAAHQLCFHLEPLGWGWEVVGLVGCSCPFLVGKPHMSVSSSPCCWIACCYGLLHVCATPEHSGIKHWWYRILVNAWRHFHLWALSSSAVLLPKPHGILPALLLILLSHNSLWNRPAHSNSILSPQMDVEVKTMKFFTGIDFSYIFGLYM